MPQNADAAASAYRCMYTDKLGSVRVVRDQNMLQKASYDYDPYGGQYLFSGLPVNHGFTGHTWDAETALYYAPYRYYSPAAARWLTRDPLGMVDGPNVYCYVGNAPSSRIDLLGLDYGIGTEHCDKMRERYLERAKDYCVPNYATKAAYCYAFCIDQKKGAGLLEMHFWPSAMCNPDNPYPNYIWN